MCACHNCRTGKCSCPQCSDGPGIDFQGIHRLHDEIMWAVVREQVRIRDVPIRDMRTSDVPRVRRWGDIERPAIAGSEETGDKDHD